MDSISALSIVEANIDNKKSIAAPLLSELTDAYNKVVELKFGPGNLDIFAAVQSSDAEVQRKVTGTLHALSKMLPDAAAEDPSFFGMTVKAIQSNNGYCGFYPKFIGLPLLRRAIDDRSPESAIAWLLKVLHTTSASGKTFHALWGAPVDSTIQLTDNVRLVPLADLPDCWVKQWLAETAQRHDESPIQTLLDYTPPQSALVLEQHIDPFIGSGEQAGSNDYLSNHEMLEDITLALTIVGRRVSLVAAYWFLFDDPDLERARIGSMRGGLLHEILPTSSDYSVVDAADAIHIVNAYIGLNEGTRAHIRVALQRLSLALRRRNLGDKAVELAVAFESLLGDNANNEMTHKITTRSVRLVGGSGDVRKKNSVLMKKAYEIRSKLVHTGSSNPNKKYAVIEEQLSGSEVIDQCIDFCIQVIRKIVLMGHMPDWAVFDISD